MSKISLIKEIAENLVSNRTKMTYDQLAKHLNDTGHRTTLGTKYTGNRGVAKLIGSVYRKLKKDNDKESAEIVANAFTNKEGNHPWD
jgi:predicted transcriptional regulator